MEHDDEVGNVNAFGDNCKCKAHEYGVDGVCRFHDGGSDSILSLEFALCSFIV